MNNFMIIDLLKQSGLVSTIRIEDTQIQFELKDPNDQENLESFMYQSGLTNEIGFNDCEDCEHEGCVYLTQN